MTITYHSQNRKELVKAISEIIGIPAVYQFMPTCAYKIGECYTCLLYTSPSPRD